MPFRRRSAKSKIARAAAAVESLESRRLLTAIVNGIFTDTDTPFDGGTIFEYRQPSGEAVRISVVGNVTAEFIGAHPYGSLTTILPGYPLIDSEITRPPSQLVLGDLVPASATQSPVWLFSIYVVQADMNSAISIATVPAPSNATPPPARPMQPFNGNTIIRVQNATRPIGATTGASTVINLAGGSVFIGAQTADVAPNDTVPLIFADRKAFGMRPSSAGSMYSGLETAPGVSLGKFFVGGTISGVVDVAGSMDTFYAGNILTGNAQGIGRYDSPQTAAITLATVGGFTVATTTPGNNFHVGGDIRNIIAGNGIGTDTLFGLADLEQPALKSGFQLSVGGRVGQIISASTTVGGFLGSLTIKDDPGSNAPGITQKELENRDGAGTALNFSYFDPQYVGYDITPADATLTGNAIATRINNNDTFGTAQFLGTTKSTVLKDSVSIDLRGTLGLSLTTATDDYTDFYAIPLLAGQTIDVQLLDDFMTETTRTQRHPRLGIFDPDGRLIASDYSNVNQYGRLNKTIRIKADRPGSYRIAIGSWGDSNFNYNGTTTEANEVVTPGFVFGLAEVNYRLRVRGVGDTALGALISTGPIATLDVQGTGITALRGDIGEIRSGTPTAAALGNALTSANLTGTGTGVIYSESLPWRVASGNLRALETVTTGATLFGALVTAYPNSGPDFLVPKGSIGLLRSFGTGNSTAVTPSVFVINDSSTHIADPSGAAGIFPSSSDDLSLTSKALAVGKDIQLVDCAGVLEGVLLANGRIGVIRAQQVGGALSFNSDSTQTVFPLNADAPVWQANVDNVGNDGIIDLIDVQTNLNSAAITTGQGGNVRYMHVGGTAFRDFFFGSGTPEARTYLPGQKVTINDDSGTQATLTPLPLDPNSTFPLPTGAQPFFDAPRLTVQTYPIRYAGGEVLVRVIVTPQDDTTDAVVRTGGGGLMVETGSKGSSGSFEIGEVARGNPNTLNANLPNLTLPAGTAANTFAFDAFNRIYTLTALGTPPPVTAPRDVNFVFKGKSTIDVWNFNDLLNADTITSIDNQTNGEIVNVSPFGANGAVAAVLPDIFSLKAETLGLAKSHTGTAVEGLAFGQVQAGTAGIDNIFPFVNQRIGIRVADVNSIATRRGLGNIIAQNIGSIVANSDRKNVSGVFEGINAPVVSRGTTNVTGNIVSVDIGEGVLPSGSGIVSRCGLYADAIIDSITGTGDIRGNVVAGGGSPFTTQQATDPVTGAALTNPDGTPMLISTPSSLIGSIKLKGGSIVDANIMTNVAVPSSTAGTAPASSELYTRIAFTTVENAPDGFDDPFFDVGPITLNGTGGIIGSSIQGADIGLISVKGGFGVLSTFMQSFNNGVEDGIVTDGYGVRGSLVNGGSALNVIEVRGNGKSVASTSFAGGVRFSEKYTFDPYSGGTLDGYNDLHKFLGTTKAKPKLTGSTETGVIQDSSFLGSELGKVTAQRIVARNAFITNATTGKKRRIPYGDATYPMQMNFSGSTGSITVRDNIDGLAFTSGTVKKISAGKQIVASLFNISGRLKELSADSLRSSSTFNISGADGQIDSVVTRHDLASSITAGQGIVNINVGRNVNSPKILAGGNTKNLSIKGSMLAGSKITVEGTLSKLFIGNDIKAGAVLQAGEIKDQQINGQVTGDIIIT